MSSCRNIRKMNRECYRTDNRWHSASEKNLAPSPSALSGPQVLRGLQMLDVSACIRVPWRFSRHHATVLLCLLSILFFPRFLAAAEWSIEPAAIFGLGYDDNPSLSPGQTNGASFIFISPRVDWSKKTEVSAVNIGLLLDATKYSGHEFKDVDSEKLSLSSFVQTTERTRWGLDGDLRWDTLFRTVQTTTGTGSLNDVDTSLVQQKTRREWMEARPSWNYALSEQSSLGLRYRITDVSFSETVGIALQDYKDQLLSANYARRISDQDNLNLVVNRIAYRPAQAGVESDTTQFLAGVSHAYSETSSGRFLVGPGKVTQSTTTTTEDTSGLVLEAAMVQRSELTTFDGVISRDVQPSGIGQSVLSNQLRMYLTRKISPMLTVVVRANWLRNNVIEGSNPDIDRRLYELIPGLSWQWRPEWAISAEYTYQNQKYDAFPDTAERNVLFIGATYIWPRHVASR
jgi:hypothetical protein